MCITCYWGNYRNKFATPERGVTGMLGLLWTVMQSLYYHGVEIIMLHNKLGPQYTTQTWT